MTCHDGIHSGIGLHRLCPFLTFKIDSKHYVVCHFPIPIESTRVLIHKGSHHAPNKTLQPHRQSHAQQKVTLPVQVKHPFVQRMRQPRTHAQSCNSACSNYTGGCTWLSVQCNLKRLCGLTEHACVVHAPKTAFRVSPGNTSGKFGQIHNDFRA